MADGMRKVTLFIAMSLDGYIAGIDGNIDWLHGQEPEQDDMVSYDEFVKSIDTVIMGWNTYHQIAVELSPEAWIYDDLKSYVLTHRELPATEQIEFVNRDVCELVVALKKEVGKDIWICGGANTIRLFGTPGTETELKLVKTQSYNGITDVVYERR